MDVGTAMGVTVGDLFGPLAPAGLASRPLPDITLDSRRATPGGLFFAVAGGRAHGLAHAADAVRAGAALVAWEPADGLSAPQLPEGASAFPVPGLRGRLGDLADRYFGRPSHRAIVIGVTGTNGKTTCTHLLASALSRLGCRAGVMGTLGTGIGGELEPSALTTPDVVEVHRGLARLCGRGARAVAMEVSSHALDQGRVDGVRFQAGAFTNLSRDHLDYHGSFEAYGESKARLFTRHEPQAAVLNVGDRFGRSLWDRLPGDMPRIAVARAGVAMPDGGRKLSITTVRPGSAGLDLVVELDGRAVTLRSLLVGEFNAENLAVGLGVLVALGYEPQAAAAALAEVHAPAGRMEAFPDPRREVLAVVDYAHTPDALAKVLQALRTHCRGRLWCVFGCGGDRDPGKRPEMGRIAESLADEVILTDDNPRTEDGAVIVADILAGFEAPGRAAVERDRAKAISQALGGAASGDVVLVAGKGHEDYQIVGGERRAFSDRAIVRELTEARS
jgi:UDP-N-acetylmuramoyl-L-alanyl-D-glutamate--2,6-diaminopimelate ligase